MNKPVSPATALKGEEHWTNKGSDVRLFLWNKYADPAGPAGRAAGVAVEVVPGVSAEAHGTCVARTGRVTRGLDPRVHLSSQQLLCEDDGLPGQARQ